MVLNWASLEPREFEGAVQMLPKKSHQDLVSIGGARLAAI